MKLAVFVTALVLVAGEPVPKELKSGLKFVNYAAAEGENIPEDFQTPEETPDAFHIPELSSNLDPKTLRVDAEEPQYHAAEGVREAARIKRVEEAPASRIAGGLSSYLGEHPFFGGLVITLLTGQTSVCGSSLVTATSVVTAAHCWHDGVDTAYSMLVVLGSTRLFYGGTRVYASSVLAHPFYTPGIRTNDIALLTIPYVAFTTYIKPIAIATGTSSHENFRAEAIGFGRTSDSSPITDSASLRDVFVTVISNAVCQYYYGGVVTDGVICTSGAGGRNPCGGDSGGPLILYSSAGNDVLIGIINFHSSDGCQSGAPGGYVRVSYHAPWIFNNV